MIQYLFDRYSDIPINQYVVKALAINLQTNVFSINQGQLFNDKSLIGT